MHKNIASTLSHTHIQINRVKCKCKCVVLHANFVAGVGTFPLEVILVKLLIMSKRPFLTVMCIHEMVLKITMVA